MKRLLCLLALFLLVGVVSADTLILFPDNDGATAKTGNFASWDVIRNGVGNLLTVTEGASTIITAGATLNYWAEIDRYGMTYNETSLAGKTITGATLYMFSRNVSGVSKANTFNQTYNISISDAYPSNQSAWAAADYNKTGTELLGSFKYDDWTASYTYNAIPLTTSYFQNATGSKVSIMFRNSKDYYDISTYKASATTYMRTYQDARAGTAQDPYIEFTYTSPDTTPPTSITNLANNTATCQQITWTWTNPVDADFNGTMIYQNGVFVHNSTGGTSSIWSSLTGGTSYTISTRTFDTSWNINTTWVNQTATATSCAGAPVASFTTSKTFLRIPNPITVADTSIPTPTSWQWSWGDGTANSTTQNATHTYTKRGIWNIVLTVEDFNGGSNTTAATPVRVIGYENYY